VIVFGVSKKELKIFLERSLRKKEKELFLISHELRGFTFSTAVRKIVEKNYPESTVKSVLRRLKHFKLVEFGNFVEKGKPLSFTPLGEAFFDVLKRDEK